MSQCHDSYEPLRHEHLPVRVEDLMNPRPITVEPTATVKEIAEAMLKHDIRSVPVVDIGERLVGVVAEADLVCREGYPTVRHHSLGAYVDEALAEHRHHWVERAEGLTAEEIMTREVVTCEPPEPVGVVTRRMLVHNVRTLPVVEDGRLVGILSRHDLLQLFCRPDPEIRARVAELLASPLWAPGHTVEAEVRDGVVILTGTVRRGADGPVVSSIVGHIPGVIDVINRIQVEEQEYQPS